MPLKIELTLLPCGKFNTLEFSSIGRVDSKDIVEESGLFEVITPATFMRIFNMYIRYGSIQLLTCDLLKIATNLFLLLILQTNSKQDESNIVSNF